jgi:hypothetical protein
MDTPESQIKPLPASTDLQGQIDSVRHLMVSVLFLLLVVSGTFNLYLWRQFRSTRAELQMVLPNAKQISGELASMQDFVHKLVEFAKTHPDFLPILAKYGIQPTADKAPAAAPAGATLPPAAGAPKK